jgi:DNA-directed RNA polymerase subunit RPC12/RpoP
MGFVCIYCGSEVGDYAEECEHAGDVIYVVCPSCSEGGYEDGDIEG